MPRFPIICALWLAGCGHDPQVIAAPPAVPADLLRPAPGHTGATPRTEGEFALAAAAEQTGRLQCNGQLLTLSQILLPN